jgi:uncharacterized protein YkwD
MRIFVIFTTIMLPAVLFLTLGGNKAVSSYQPTLNPLETSVKPTQIPQLSLNIPQMCTEKDLGYSPMHLTIAGERQKGFLTEEIEQKVVDEVPEESEQTVASIVMETDGGEEVPPTASPSAVPVESVTTPPPSAGSSGVLNADVLFSLVSQTRTNAGLPAFTQHPEVCSVALSRAPELDNEIYGNSYMHAGFHARSLPFWATENMISQQTETDALHWWMNSPVHRSAILGDYTYACTACAGKSCAMIFSNLTPK